MPFFETVALAIGPAIAKAMLEKALGKGLLNTLGGTGVDAVKRKADDLLAQNKKANQLNVIGLEVVDELWPLFQHDSRHLSEDDRGVVVIEVCETLTQAQLTPQLLVQLDLMPDQLNQHLIDVRPDATRLLSEDQTEIYRRVLSAAAHAIIKTIPLSPEFAGAAWASNLQDQARIIEGIRLLLAGPTIEAENYEVTYRETVQKHLNKMDWFGVEPIEGLSVDGMIQQQRLDKAFVPLDVSWKEEISIKSDLVGDSGHEAVSRGLGRRGLPRDVQLEARRGPLEQLLATSRRIVLLGQAGAGKSTHMRWLAVKTARRELSPLSIHLKEVVPFRINLRECIGHGFPVPGEYHMYISKSAHEPPRNWVQDQLRSGQALILIDGMDEVPQDKRTMMLDGLRDLMTNAPLATYIITSRPQAVKAEDWPEWRDWVSSNGFIEATLESMTLPQIHTFIDHWHAAFEETQLHLDEDEARMQSDDLKKHLSERPSLRRLADNPLLCAMICALHTEWRQNLPAERIKLYEACVGMLLGGRDKRRGVPEDDYRELRNIPKIEPIQSLAYWMMEQGVSESSATEIDQHLKEFLVRYASLSSMVTPQLVRNFYVMRANLLIDQVGQIEFTHRTFQEFLAAKQALSLKLNTGLKFLAGKCRDPLWRETIIMAAIQATLSQRDDLLESLIKKGDRFTTSVHDRKQVYMLALACLEARGGISPEVREKVLLRAAEAFPPENDDEIKLIAAAGDQAIHFLKPLANYTEPQAACCIETLALIGTDHALEAIAEYAIDARYDVQRALGRAWDNFNRVSYLQQVLSKTKRVVLPKLPAVNEIDQLTHVTSLEVASVGDDLSLLLRLTSLTKLDIWGEQLTDLGPLAGLTNLTELSVINTQVSDLRPLAGLTKLVNLNIQNAQVSDLRPLAELKNLTTLQIWSSQVNNLQPLGGLRNLTSLYVIFSLVDDLRPLEKLTNLTVLFVIGGMIKDLQPLAGLTKLVELAIWNSSASDLRPLTGLVNLTNLSVTNTPISDLSPLAELTNLTTLRVIGTQVRDLSPLAELKNLEELDIDNTRISDLRPLVGMTKLTRLLVFNTQVTDLSPLAQLPNLKNLVIDDGQKLDTKPLEGIKDLIIDKVRS